MIVKATKKALILESLDKHIIRILLENPTITMTLLSKKSNLSDVAIIKRVGKLKKYGVIEFKVILKDLISSEDVKSIIILDPLDIHIIEILLEKPKSTMTSLAVKCNRSDVAIAKRVCKLEERGIIEFKVILKEGLDLDKDETIVCVVDSSEKISSDSIHEVPDR